MPRDLDPDDEQPIERDTIVVEDALLRQGFTQVPNLILRMPGVSHGAKLTYALLLSYAWQEGSCFPGQDQLAKDLSVERKAVIRYLKELKDKQIIQVVRRGMGKTNVYILPRLSDVPKMGHQEVPKTGPLEVPPVGQYKYSTTNTQKEKYNSNTRKASPKNDQTDEAAQGSTQPHEPTQPEVRYEKFAQPEQSPPTQPPGLNRSYLIAARAKDQPKTHDLTSIASILPQPLQPPKRTYTEERQVLVEVIADLAREFRDEAKLTESVSRAYNLMQQAKIADIGVFTSKIYEARSITKERYGTIERRMPYFFSVLADVCGLKKKHSGQTAESVQQT